MSLLIKRLLREGIDNKIVCDKCGWSWKKSESGPDMYFCHKCGNDNTPDNISESDNLNVFKDYENSLVNDGFEAEFNIENDKLVTIEIIGVPKKLHGQGYGTKIMNHLCSLADSHGVTLQLRPSASSTHSRTKLINFYSKFGFVVNKDLSNGYQYMYREPKTKLNENLQQADKIYFNTGIEDGYRYLEKIGVDLNKLNDEPQEELAEGPEKKSKKSLKVTSNQLSLFERRKFIRESIRTRLMEQRVKYYIPLPSDILAIKDVFKKNGYKLYVVGGAVRDALLGKEPKDIDLTTDAIPDKVEEIMTKAGFKTLPTGKVFGVINVFTDQGEYEIATFRSDETKGRKPEVKIGATIEFDAARRDLRINALYYDIDNKEIIDLVGGLEDLKNGTIRMVGNPQERFEEDPLRILRFFRFLCRFD
jgi:hypothetical protein